MEEHYRNYRINSSSYKSETGWTYQTTVEEWVDVGSDFNVIHWSAEHPFESAAKAEEAGLAWARSMIDSFDTDRRFLVLLIRPVALVSPPHLGRR